MMTFVVSAEAEMGRPVHFEIHASDPERSREFYEQVFGWAVQRWGEQAYWMIFTGEDDRPGINGGLVPREGPAPALGAAVNAFVVTVDVDDLDATIEAALKYGGEIRLPRMPVQGVGWLAYLADPDGNLFGVMQADDSVPG
jgi:predicted enzyme related to lactoylglutathione lyase